MIKFTPNQANMFCYVMVDDNCDEVPGLGAGCVIEVSKAGGAFAAATGAQAEISNGWYSYTATAVECNTVGPLAFRINGAGCVQQNILFFVYSPCVGCIEFTYTLTEPAAGPPIADATVNISVDLAGLYIVWCGTTDAFGVARDGNGELPCLDPGTYAFWRSRSNYEFINPDVEIVS